MFFLERAGSGRPLVLIHGLGGPRMWECLLPLLARHFSVSSVHLPGFGSTPPLPQSASTAELASGILKALPHWAAEQLVVVGTSYGGQLAIEIASGGNSVAALVLVAGSGLAPKHWIADSDAAWNVAAAAIRSVALRSRWIMEQSSRRSFYDLRRRPEDLVESFRENMEDAGRRASWAGMFRNALRSEPGFEEKLRTLRIPTLIVAARGDRIVPAASAARLHALIPGSSLTLLEQCGHSIALEQPELLRDLILAHAGV